MPCDYCNEYIPSRAYAYMNYKYKFFFINNMIYLKVISTVKRYSQCKVQCTLYNTHCTVYNVHCTTNYNKCITTYTITYITY